MEEAFFERGIQAAREGDVREFVRASNQLRRYRKKQSKERDALVRRVKPIPIKPLGFDKDIVDEILAGHDIPDDIIRSL